MRRSALLVALVPLILPAAAAASSHAVNFQTKNTDVACGVVAAVPGTELDPGTGAQLGGDYPGLQCSAPGIPKPKQGFGDPFVQLGQGSAGRARLIDESQDDLISAANPVTLPPGAVWERYGIVCKLAASSVSCANGVGYGFTLSTGHLHLISPARAPSPASAPTPKRCGGVSYTFPHTDGHGHAALNNLTAVGVSCSTARTVASDFLVTGKPPRNWHATSKLDGGEEILTRGKARVTGDLAN
jgi:hypothetical protein